MTTASVMNIIVIIVVGIIGWLLKAGYDSWVKKVDGKMDKDCHDMCSEGRDKMNTLILDELKANRQIALGLVKDFNEKSELVIKAVEK